MVTEVKMEVTPDLSSRIQEIVFANGGDWGCEGVEINHVSSKYLYIEKKGKLGYGDDKSCFEEHKFKEVSPYDFIASQGQQEWLPKYYEEALFSDNGKDWYKENFINYTPCYTYPFSVLDGDITYKFCKKIPKTVSFIQFLKDNNCYKEYMNNCKIVNQRWSVVSGYRNPEEIKILEPTQWIDFAFNFYFQKETKSFWNTLNKKWKKLLEQNSDANIVWGE